MQRRWKPLQSFGQERLSVEDCLAQARTAQKLNDVVAMERISLIGQLTQYVFTGITVGSIYALVAVGFNIIYNVTEIINFAQGELSLPVMAK